MNPVLYVVNCALFVPGGPNLAVVTESRDIPLSILAGFSNRPISHQLTSFICLLAEVSTR